MTSHDVSVTRSRSNTPKPPSGPPPAHLQLPPPYNIFTGQMTKRATFPPRTLQPTSKFPQPNEPSSSTGTHDTTEEAPLIYTMSIPHARDDKVTQHVTATTTTIVLPKDHCITTPLRHALFTHGISEAENTQELGWGQKMEAQLDFQYKYDAIIHRTIVHQLRQHLIQSDLADAHTAHQIRLLNALSVELVQSSSKQVALRVLNTSHYDHPNATITVKITFIDHLPYKQKFFEAVMPPLQNSLANGMLVHHTHKIR